MQSFLKRLWSFLRRIRLIPLVVGGGVILLVLMILFPESRDTTPVAEETAEKTLEVVSFGEWEPGSTRELLATIESTGDINVNAELTGTIEKVYVSIGDTVTRGQLLAQFQRINDQTQINYNNALRSLETTKLSAQNSVLNAQIALDTARNELEQTRAREAQNYQQVFEALRVQTQNADTTINAALTWLDQIYAVSTSYRNSQQDAAYHRVGSNQSVERQSAYNELARLIKWRNNWSSIPSYVAEEELIAIAEDRLRFTRALQNLVWNTHTLITKTPVVSSFSESTKQSLLSEADQKANSMDGIVSQLNTQLESAKSEKERNRLSLLSSENTVKKLESSLELAKANADSSVSTAQNQVSLTQSSQADLEVRAPFAGTITAQNINAYSQVNAGTALFSIVGQDSVPKAVAYLNKEELSRIVSSETLKIRLSNGDLVETDTSFLSTKVDTASQKARVEFILPELPRDVLVGSYAKVLMPVQNGKKNLLPITAVSFEPGGAEVLIVNAEQKAERRMVSFGQSIGDAIEILDGLGVGTPVVRHRNRAYAGDIIHSLQ